MSPLPPTQPPTPPHSCPPSLDKEGTEPAGLWCLFALEEVGPISPLPAELPGRASSVGRGLSQREHLCQVTDGHLRSLPGLSPCSLSLFRTAELCPCPLITPPVSGPSLGPEDLAANSKVTALPGWPHGQGGFLFSLWLWVPILGSLINLRGAASHR